MLLQLLSFAAGQDELPTPEKNPAFKVYLRRSYLDGPQDEAGAGQECCTQMTEANSKLHNKYDYCQKRNKLLQSFVGDKLKDLEQKLRDAAKGGNVEEIKKLLDLGVNASAADGKGYSPLHWAMDGTSLDAVEALLEGNANVDALDQYKWTPLHWAAYYDKDEFARALLDYGASTTLRGYQGRTPLEVAQHYNKAKVLKLLSN